MREIRGEAAPSVTPSTKASFGGKQGQSNPIRRRQPFGTPDALRIRTHRTPEARPSCPLCGIALIPVLAFRAS